MNNLEMRINELEIENERLKEWRYQLERSIEHNNRVMSMLREENEEMANRLRVYKRHCLNEQEEKQEYKLPFMDETTEALENLSKAIRKARDTIKATSENDGMVDVL